MRRRMAGGMLSLAILSAVALATAPAYGQSAGVGNTGDASASSGNNSSAGNASTNTAANSSSQTTTDETLVGGLLGLVLNLSTSSTNTSNGTSSINTGTAQASGNNSDTAVGQSGGGAVVGTVFGPVVVSGQGAGVSNSGSGSANTGDNSGAGNASTNTATNSQTVTGGLINIGLTLGQTASNISNGTSQIDTGDANAAGNQSTTEVAQFGAGGGFSCDGFFRFTGQRVDVSNDGVAAASTGGNDSVGNQSANVATNSSSVSGGVINVAVPGLLSTTAANASDGQSAINSGAANAAGNSSTTEVVQECGTHAAFVSPPVIVPGVVVKGAVQPHGGKQLARTGVDPFVMGVFAFALLFGGFLFMVWERVEAIPRVRPPAS